MMHLQHVFLLALRDVPKQKLPSFKVHEIKRKVMIDLFALNDWKLVPGKGMKEFEVSKT